MPYLFDSFFHQVTKGAGHFYFRSVDIFSGCSRVRCLRVLASFTRFFPALRRFLLPFLDYLCRSERISAVHPLLVLRNILVFCSEFIPILTRARGEDTVQLYSVAELDVQCLNEKGGSHNEMETN